MLFGKVPEGGGRADSIVAAHLAQGAPVLLGRAALVVGAGLAEQLAALDFGQPARDAGLGFLVELAGDGRGGAHVGQSQDDYVPLVGAIVDEQFVACAQRPRRLDLVAADLDLAAVDGVGGQRTGFKEARGPQPLIDTDSVAQAYFPTAKTRISSL